MIFIIERLQDESYLFYVWRVNKALEDGLIELDEWSESILGETPYSKETLRRCSLFFDKFITLVEKEGFGQSDKEDKVKILEAAKLELQKERKKIQTANIEYNENLRSEARLEMFNEQIREAIDKLPSIKFTKEFVRDLPQRKVGILAISDAHNGVEINMKTIYNEVVNVYSPEILKARLNKLINDIVDDSMIYIDYDRLCVFDLGDAIQNYLRMSDIAKVKTGVVESTLQYAEMISQFLVELSERLQIPVTYFCVGGNHDTCRFLTGKKTFEEENLGRVIREFIYLRLKDNPNIIVEPYNEFAFYSFDGLNILAIHGDDSKNDIEEVAYWENYHDITIDILLMGHFHHFEQKSIGYSSMGDKEIIKVPSLVGVDDFSKRNRKIAKAGAKFFLVEDGCKTWEKTYHLN